MNEWYDIPGYEGIYQITPNGEVRNVETNLQLYGNINSHGYKVISLTKYGKRKSCKLHRLLAITFIPNPHDYECINHIDGDKLNNDLTNLEWCTKGYNNRHAREVLKVDMSSKAVYQTTIKGEFIAAWASIGQAAKFAGITPPCIVDCCEGRAKSAGNYCWSYAGQAMGEIILDFKKSATIKQIARLEQQIENLRSQL